MSGTETASEIGAQLRSLGRQLRECSDAVWRLKGSPEHDNIAREVWQLSPRGYYIAQVRLRGFRYWRTIEGRKT